MLFQQLSWKCDASIPQAGALEIARVYVHIRKSSPERRRRMRLVCLVCLFVSRPMYFSLFLSRVVSPVCVCVCACGERDGFFLFFSFVNRTYARTDIRARSIYRMFTFRVFTLNTYHVVLARVTSWLVGLSVFKNVAAEKRNGPRKKRMCYMLQQ